MKQGGVRRNEPCHLVWNMKLPHHLKEINEMINKEIFVSILVVRICHHDYFSLHSLKPKTIFFFLFLICILEVLMLDFSGERLSEGLGTVYLSLLSQSLIKLM